MGTRVRGHAQKFAPMNLFNLEDLKFFLELVRSGSPSAASKKIKADHTTVRRRIQALESALQARLFASRGQNYELTPEGDRLLKYAEEIEKLALRAQDDVANSGLSVAGTVRIGAPDGFGAFFLAPRMATFSAAYPDLKIQLIVLPRIMTLSNREAELAIALSPPSQLRQVVRKLTDYKLYVYASESYLETHPPICAVSDLKAHPFVGYIPDLIYAPELDYLAELDPELSTPFESTNIIAQLRSVVAGAGLAILPSFMAKSEPTLRPVLPKEFSIDRQFWLVIHPEAINLARVRTMIELITDSVRRDRSLFLSPD